MTSTTNQSNQSSVIVAVLRCFNVAAITALGGWHGYVFHADHYASAHAAPMQLIAIKNIKN